MSQFLATHTVPGTPQDLSPSPVTIPGTLATSSAGPNTREGSVALTGTGTQFTASKFQFNWWTGWVHVRGLGQLPKFHKYGRPESSRKQFREHANVRKHQCMVLRTNNHGPIDVLLLFREPLHIHIFFGPDGRSLDARVCAARRDELVLVHKRCERRGPPCSFGARDHHVRVLFNRSVRRADVPGADISDG